MAKIAIVFGLLLIVLGVGTYLAAPIETRSPTAIIFPGIAGVLLAICGVAAMSPGIRKHAMHAAAAVGLLGCLGAAGKLISVVISGGGLPSNLKLIGMGGMAILCGVFVALCVKSFIDVRKARAQG
jgi:hypothetical protein